MKFTNQIFTTIILLNACTIFSMEVPKEMVTESCDALKGALENGLANGLGKGLERGAEAFHLAILGDPDRHLPGFANAFPNIAQAGLAQTGVGLTNLAHSVERLSTSFAGNEKKAQHVSFASASAAAPSDEQKIHVPESQSSNRFAPPVPSMSREEHLPISHAMVQAAQNLKPLELNTHTAIRGAGIGMAIVSANQLGAQCGPCCAAGLLCGGLYFMKNAHRVDQDMHMAQNYLSKINKQNAKEIASRTKEAAANCCVTGMIKGFDVLNMIAKRKKD